MTHERSQTMKPIAERLNELAGILNPFGDGPISAEMRALASEIEDQARACRVEAAVAYQFDMEPIATAFEKIADRLAARKEEA